MTDLIQRLRLDARADSIFGDDVRKKITNEAADALEKQQAEIERLRVQVAKLAETVCLLSEGNVTLIKERDALKAQAAKNTADAGRYRYWRDKHGWSGYFDDGATNSDDNKDIDAAIDAAMKESQQ